jgi:hypothetical protein
MTKESPFTWLYQWYESHCDDLWEHAYGIEIGTLDNPGWRIEIDLTGTSTENVPFSAIEHNYEDDTDWWRCWVEEKVFNGAGGTRSLEPMLEVFKSWVLAQDARD